jgi:hypothetical protein
LHITNPIKHVSKVELLYASVPNSLYNITGTEYSESVVLSDTSNTFSIAPGFYNATSLALELQNAMYNKINVSVEYLPSEGKFLFSRPTSTGFSLISLTEELSKLIGIPMYYDSVTVSITDSSNNVRYTGKEFIKSEYVTNISAENGIFLDIEELRTNNNEDAVSMTGNTYSGQTMRRSFGYIPMDVNPGSIKHFKKDTDYDFSVSYDYPIQKIDRLTVKWVNQNGQIVNFNGDNDNSFLLRFICEK